MIEKKTRELCLKRIRGAVFCNVLLQVVFIIAFLLFVNIEIFHPFRWIEQWLSCTFSFSTWLYVIPLCVVIVSQGMVCSTDYISLPPFYRTRISFFIQIFSFHNQRVAFLHLLIGFLVPWIYLSLAPELMYNRFIFDCTDGFANLQCFSEERLYLILACLVVNIYYLIDSYFLDTRHLTFPIIQLPRLDQIKAHLLPILKETLRYTMIPNSFYMMLYYFLGGSIRSLIMRIFSLHYNSLNPIDTLYGIFSLKRFLYLQFLTVVTVASMKIMEMLFKVHLTQRCIFPICLPLVDENNEIALKDALQYAEYPIIQHLGYLDLVKLAENDHQRRSEIYKLSVPGGHPHTWNSLKNECIKTIDEFTQELSSLLIISKKAKEAQLQTRVKPRMAHSTPISRPTQIKENIIQTFFDDIYECFSNKVKQIKNLKVIVYFFGELQEMKIQFLLRKSLVVMWAVQSLSFLSCYSLTEDMYGIVQNELNQIITSVLKLKHMLDVLDKYFISTYKNPRSLGTYRKGLSLKKSVKRSLYQLANSFRPYITDIQLSKDYESEMMSFVNYRE